MSAAFVVDCSVAMAWLFHDEATPKTAALLRRVQAKRRSCQPSGSSKLPACLHWPSARSVLRKRSLTPSLLNRVARWCTSARFRCQNVCGDGLVDFLAGGTFSTGISSTNAQNTVNVRWHCSGNGGAGGWLPTQGTRQIWRLNCRTLLAAKHSRLA